MVVTRVVMVVAVAKIRTTAAVETVVMLVLTDLPAVIAPTPPSV
jgi:hypothetical protein